MSQRRHAGTAVRSRAVLALSACVLSATACGTDGDGDAAPEEASSDVDVPTEGVYGQAPLPVAGVPSVLMLEPHGPVEVVWPEMPTMDQLGLQFSPRRMVVPLGEPVQFHNSETLAHNVHIRSVESGATVFNADSPPDGSAIFVFEEGGGYDVLCDTHPGMTAFVYATLAPYASIADEDGAFRIEDVLPGDYTLHVWSADPEKRSEQAIVVRGGAATEVRMAPLG